MYRANKITQASFFQKIQVIRNHQKVLQKLTLEKKLVDGIGSGKMKMVRLCEDGMKVAEKEESSAVHTGMILITLMALASTSNQIDRGYYES